MIQINMHEAKTHLSRYIKQVEAGETIILCKHNVPIAEIRPIPKRSREPRPLGPLSPDRAFEIPASFWDPLPPDIQAAFEGRGP